MISLISYEQQKKEFELSHKAPLDNNEHDEIQHISAEQLGVFYKKFLTENYASHQKYNRLFTMIQSHTFIFVCFYFNQLQYYI